MATPDSQAPRKIRVAGAVAGSAVFAFLAASLWVPGAFAIYYVLADHYYNPEHGWLTPDGILRNFKFAFYGILATWIVSVPSVAYAAARWFRAPRVASVLLSVAFLALIAWPALSSLSFSNACNLGESFPLPDAQC